MKNLRVKSSTYELLAEQAKQKKYRTVESYLDALALGNVK
jgi:hypothetical protein